MIRSLMQCLIINYAPVVKALNGALRTCLIYVNTSSNYLEVRPPP